MQPNPFTGLIHSRKFLLAMLDALVSSVALVLAWFLSPDKVASVLALIGIWQPVLIAVIIGIAAEDVALSKSSAEMYKADSDVVAAKAYGDVIKESPAIAVPCDEKPQG